MKTLIIKYLPGREISNTNKLYNYLIEKLGKNDVTEIDLEKTPPVFFDNSKLMAYYQRNYQGKPLSEEQKNQMAVIDDFTNNVKEADVVIVFSPMHNFGMPGIIKTWFDNVIQKGIAFEYGPKGPYGMFNGKKALTVYTSGGAYSTEKVTVNFPEWDTFNMLSKIEFGFMGFSEIEVVSASTGNPEKIEGNINEAKNKISEIITKWIN